MVVLAEQPTNQWKSLPNWKRASYNTVWCLIGCSIGDFGTIFFFQMTGIPWPTILIMTLAVVNGILTSIALETACGMSLISMVSMEIVMNAVDVLLTGGAKLTIWVIPIMLLAGFLTPLPYNYWRLQVHGKSCH